MDVDFGVLGGSASQYLGVLDPTTDVSGVTGTGANTSPIQVGFDNSNVAGIVGGTGAANQVAAGMVATGVGLGISLADLGSPALGDEIKVTAFINGSNHNFVSNQFLGGLPAATSNLGSPDGVSTYFDLTDHTGNQFFSVTVVPEPSSMLLVALGLIGWMSTSILKRVFRSALTL